MEAKRRITRQQRRAARDEAFRRLDDVAAHAQEVRVNDAICSHITVFLDTGERVEWWPGAQHWRIGLEDWRGDMEEFLEWLQQ